MNIIEMFRDVKKDIEKYSYEKNEKTFKNLLSHGYAKINKLYHKNEEGYGDTLFIVVQDILIWLMFSDGHLVQGEYDGYLEFCNYADYEPLTIQQCSDRCKKLDVDYLITLIKHIVTARGHIPEADYESFVKALCLIALFGDQEIDQDEYIVLSCFFSKEDDICPSWEEFLKEWN